jgi:hypothetical protein
VYHISGGIKVKNCKMDLEVKKCGIPLHGLSFGILFFKLGLVTGFVIGQKVDCKII